MRLLRQSRDAGNTQTVIAVCKGESNSRRRSERNEQFNGLAAQFANGRPAGNSFGPINGGVWVPLGRHIEICVPESRCWTIYEAWISGTAFHGDCRRLVGDHRWLVTAYRVFDTADSCAIYD